MSWETATILIGGIATLAIYSFLISENKLYRFFEHLFIGMAAGFLPILTLQNYLWPNVFVPLLGLDIVQYPDGTYSKEYSYWYLLYLMPMAFGLLYYTLYSKRFSWMAKLVIGFTLGAAGGLAFKGFFAEMIPQLVGSFRVLIVYSENGDFNWWKSINEWIFLITLLSVMYYFFFTIRKFSEGGKSISNAGRWLMMICFGAFFGSTVMARMSLLVERLQFLINDWWVALVQVVI